MLGGLAAADAHVAYMLLLEGHTPGRDTGLLLHFQLTLQIAAPHSLGEAALRLHELLDLVQGHAHLGVVLQVLLGALVQAVVDGVQQLRHRDLQLAQRDKAILHGFMAEYPN